MSQELSKMYVVLDVDQTLCDIIVPQVRIYNDRLGLGMTEPEILASGNFLSTFAVPQIDTFRHRGEDAERLFQSVRTEIRTSPEIHLAYPELPGSIEGAYALCFLGEVSYYTVRPPAVKPATVEWLQQMSAPNPEHVVICDNAEDKLLRIIRDKLVGNNATVIPTVILIDDGARKLAEAADTIVKRDRTMRQYMEHIILVGFGCTRDTMELEGAFYPDTGLRMLSLPDWQKDNVLNVVRSVSTA